MEEAIQKKGYLNIDELQYFGYKVAWLKLQFRLALQSFVGHWNARLKELALRKGSPRSPIGLAERGNQRCINLRS